MKRLLPAFPAIFVILWSTGFVGARYAMPHAEPFTFLSMRYALAMVILAVVVVVSAAPLPKVRPAVHAMIAGSLIHGVYLGGVFYAVRHGLDAGIAALIVGLSPILTAFLAAAWLGERVGPRHAFGLALGLFGVALVVAPQMGAGNTGGAYDLRTLAPCIAAAVGMALGSVWQKRFVGAVDLRTGTAFQYLGALVPTLTFALATETNRVEWTGELIFALAWLTGVLSIGAILLLVYLIREGAVSSVTSLLYLVPGATVIEAYFLFGERLSAIQLLGLAIACVGVAAATRRGGRARTGVASGRPGAGERPAGP